MIGKSEKHKQSGSVLLMVAVMIFLLLGFIAAGVEAGRWFLVRAELAKSVDAGALIAARNLSNPNVNVSNLALEYTAANFPAGSVGTPAAGGGSAAFTITMLAANRVQVDGRASAGSIFAQLLGFGLVPVHGLSVAQKRQVEIMLVLDRSGSMSGAPMTDLKKAANKFVDYFQTTQADDRMGLISFSTWVKVDRALGVNFVTPMKNAITGMNANGWTNAEDAIDQCNNASGFTPQPGVPPQDRIAQFMIFFSDGRPNSFRYNFVNKDVQSDWIVTQESNCDPGAIGNNVGNYVTNPVNGNQINTDPAATGDGKAVGSACGNTNSTRWLVMDTYPIAGYASVACNIPQASTLCPYVCDTAENLALIHAQELKGAGVTVYSVGYGEIHSDFMKGIASNPALFYLAPTSADLQAIFQKIALEIKLRLVQ